MQHGLFRYQHSADQRHERAAGNRSAENRAKFSFTTIGQELWRQLTESLRFLRRHTDIAVKMLLGCSHRLRRHSDDFLFTAAFFPANGISLGRIGFFLLIAELGGMAGTKSAAALAGKLPFGRLAAVCALLAAGAAMLTARRSCAVCGRRALVCGSFLLFWRQPPAMRSIGSFHSDQRATLISVSSILFSIAMIAAHSRSQLSV